MNWSFYSRLDEAKNVVRCASEDDFTAAWDIKNRRVAQTFVGDVCVSTVFLVIDHGFGLGPPLWFETMVFGGLLDQEQDRCATWEEAERMHASMVARVQASLSE